MDADPVGSAAPRSLRRKTTSADALTARPLLTLTLRQEIAALLCSSEHAATLVHAQDCPAWTDRRHDRSEAQAGAARHVGLQRHRLKRLQRLLGRVVQLQRDDLSRDDGNGAPRGALLRLAELPLSTTLAPLRSMDRRRPG
jgi:hypothetical protein